MLVTGMYVRWVWLQGRAVGLAMQAKLCGARGVWLRGGVVKRWGVAMQRSGLPRLGVAVGWAWLCRRRGVAM